MNLENKEITLALTDIKWLLNNKNENKELIDIRKLKFTAESKYSITPWREATIITEEIINFFGNNMITITDATANVGGNTIDFYNNKIQYINSVEIDKKTCKILINNLSVYGYKTCNVYNKDYLHICMDLSQNCIFFDPPWGGSDYIKQDKIDLFLSEINIVDLIYKLLLYNRAELIVLKAPRNFNYENAEEKLKECIITKIPMYRGKDKKHSYDVLYIHPKLYGELDSNGYCGIFRGKVYDSNGNLISNADKYFTEIENSDKVNEVVDLYPHLEKYWCKKFINTSKYGFQAGFGGDEGSGLIDFCFEKPVKCPPSMKFIFHGKKYKMKFNFQ